MKKVNNAWKIYSILFTALCVTYALSDQPGTDTNSSQPRAILNAKELGIDDIDLDLDDVDIDAVVVDDESLVSDIEIEEAPAEEEVVDVAEVVEEPEAVEEVAEAAEEAVEEAPVDEVEEIVEVVEEPEAVEEVAEVVEETVEEAPVDEVEEIVEVVEEPEAVEEVAEVVEETVEEAPVDEVEEIAEVVEEPEAVEEVAEVVEETVEEAPVDEVEEIAEVVEEPEAVEEVAEVVEETVEEAPVDEVEEIVEVVEEPEAVEEVAEVVEETKTPKSIDEEIDAILGMVVDTTTDTPILESDDTVVEAKVEEVADVAEEADEAIEKASAEVEEVVEVVEKAPAEEEVVDVAEEPTEIDNAIDEAMTIEIARRAAYDKHVIQCIKVSEDNLARGKYDTAIKELTDVQPYIRESRVDLRNSVEEKLAEAYYRKAITLRQARNYTEAEAAARQARNYAHQNAEELLFQIKNDQENPPALPSAKKIKRWNEKEYKDSIDDIRSRLSRAREYYSTGEYDLCRREVEFCLRDYPWCKDAVGMLRKVNTRMDEFYDNERLSTRKDMLAEVTKTWTPDNYGIRYDDAGYNSRGTSTSEESIITLGTTEEMKILEKMKRITIPEIDFRQANITDVITFLSEASREYDEDKDIPEERRGINIILNLGSSAEPAAAPAADDFGGGWDSALSDTSSTASTGGVPPITTSARFVTLLDAMNMIMDVAKLKYRVKGNMVLVMPANAPDGDLLHRMYPVLPSFVEKAKSLRETEKASGDFGDALQIESTKFEDNQDWKKFFGELGVQWPEGSTVKYVGSIGKLIVKNTSEQLASLEKVLAELNVTPHQVEIEVRFVEVMQTDLDSLGFEWNLGKSWDSTAELGGNGITGTRLEGVASRLPDGSWSSTTGFGNLTTGFNFLTANSNPKIAAGGFINDGIAKVTTFLSQTEVSMILHMLSTKKNSDLLSAPKVVTASGREATIKVVTEYIYPTSYDVEMLESDSGDDGDGTTYAGAVVEPGDFMTREVGVILSVTPEVAPDGSRIYLRLAPSVISEPTWKNYGSEYPMSVPVESNIIGDAINALVPYTRYETKMAKLNMEQPFFPVRSVVTELDVYNGSTVVMGGMITEERIACEDKIPVLGDIPLIGHLFRNKYEQSEKRNLLLFVTARLVDAGGREVKNPSVDGIFAE